MTSSLLDQAKARLTTNLIHYNQCASFYESPCSACGSHIFDCDCSATADVLLVLKELNDPRLVVLPDSTSQEYADPESRDWDDPANDDMHDARNPIACMCRPRVVIKHMPMVTEDGEGGD